MQSIVATKIHQDLSLQALLEQAIERGEGRLSDAQALTTTTGERTGRSPKDRYIVRDQMTAQTVAWGAINQPIEPEVFTKLWQRATEHLRDKEVFISHLRVGADPKHFLPVEVITETAWHNLFAQHLFIRPTGDYAEGKEPWTILSAPSLHTDPKVDGTNSEATAILNFTEQKVLLLGLRYAGEMKKAMFTVMNYFMPEEKILPMHCAANVGKAGDVALFFGLSGTGKTTLSADPERYLIGDDEHGWGKDRVFNFEGGCYAKCIDLSVEREPIIWKAIRDGAIMENVVLNDQGAPDFSDSSLTLNTRAAYPREHIPQRIMENFATEPKAVLFLTCDLYGVLPPLSLLTKEQAAYHFLSGYTALVGGTEVGSKGIKPTFSTCFGAPFFPRPASEYAKLLIQRITESGCQVYLINTGWTGGAYGAGGERFSIPATRAIVTAAISSQALTAPTEVLPGFDLRVPTVLPGIDSQCLNPENTWQDKAAFHHQLNQLIDQFTTNFTQFNIPELVQQAGPKPVVE
ncbi:MAG: phosphoenolpyruvate carboxykinase [Gammaproteobacteria bacterium]|nr:phosphoenolpyruvate carboxykinase [Gammaproteobacteria bacterium]